MTSRTVQFGTSKNGEDLGRDLDQDPGDHDVGDGDAIDLAPLQFDEKLLQAALREAALGCRRAIRSLWRALATAASVASFGGLRIWPRRTMAI